MLPVKRLSTATFSDEGVVSCSLRQPLEVVAGVAAGECVSTEGVLDQTGRVQLQGGRLSPSAFQVVSTSKARLTARLGQPRPPEVQHAQQSGKRPNKTGPSTQTRAVLGDDVKLIRRNISTCNGNGSCGVVTESPLV